MPYAIEFHAIQKDLSDADILDKPKNLFLHQDLLTNFAESAALLAELDMIISIDTAVAHLAGALGLKTLVLIPNPPDFMALTEINYSPWYLNTSLIRQGYRGIWPANQIKEEILKAASIQKTN